MSIYVELAILSLLGEVPMAVSVLRHRACEEIRLWHENYVISSGSQNHKMTEMIAMIRLLKRKRFLVKESC